MPNHASTTIIAWKKLSRRSELLAEALNAKLWFFQDNLPYARAAFQTLLKTIRQKPRIIIIQLPQGPLLLEALILRKLIGCRVIADVHTGFLLSTDWKGLLLNVPFVKLLHKADIVTAHNDTQLNLIPKKAESKTIVVFDQWHLVTGNKESGAHAERGNYVVFPASFASDEPLQEVIDSINQSNIDAKMYITGNWKRQPALKEKYSSEKIIFTGFLSAEKFSSLLADSAAIVTGTKREYTSLMSGWEAIAYSKPLAVTETHTLKNLYGEYAIFYNWKNSQSIANAVKTALNSKPNLLAREKLKQRTIKSLKQLEQKMHELS
jgi:hypothetical protein